MKVTINRNHCGHHPASCEKCFGEFLLHGGVPDRGCITNVEEDGRTDVTVNLTSGRYTTNLVVNDENRQDVIYNGYIRYANLPPEAFDIVPPHGADIRRLLLEQEEQKPKH